MSGGYTDGEGRMLPLQQKKLEQRKTKKKGTGKKEGKENRKIGMGKGNGWKLWKIGIYEKLLIFLNFS